MMVMMMMMMMMLMMMIRMMIDDGDANDNIETSGGGFASGEVNPAGGEQAGN